MDCMMIYTVEMIEMNYSMVRLVAFEKIRAVNSRTEKIGEILVLSEPFEVPTVEWERLQG